MTTIGLIGRFKPLHLGAAGMLERACEQADHVVIGIGSSNVQNWRNPFSAEVTAGMIDAHLSERFSNYSFVFIPDYGNDKRWRADVLGRFQGVNTVITGNAYVQDILRGDFTIIDPIAAPNPIEIRASQVRYAMARGEDISKYVPPAVHTYMQRNGLEEFYRSTYGEEALQYASTTFSRDSAEAEKEIIVS